MAAGSTDNFAGVVGYLGGDRVMNCANYGTITFDDTKCAAGGVAGYLNNTTTYIQNCMNVGTVHCTISDSPDYGGAIIGRIKNNWSSERVVNNYWLEGSAYAPAKKDDGTSPAAGTSATAEQMASGEICYKLNGDQQEIVWFQTLPNPQDETVVADPYPVLFGDHLVVWPSINGGYTNNEADEINEIQVAEQPAQFGIYNLAGQRLEKMQKGINIVNGKKVLVK